MLYSTQDAEQDASRRAPDAAQATGTLHQVQELVETGTDWLFQQSGQNPRNSSRCCVT
jgi:hypothetical protein